MFCHVSVYLRIGIFVLLLKDAFEEQDFDYFPESEENEEDGIGFGDYNQKHDFPFGDTGLSDIDEDKSESINLNEADDTKLSNIDEDKSESINLDEADDDFLKDCPVCGIINDPPHEKESSMRHFYERVKPYYRYPWIATLFNFGMKRNICTGAIIHKQYVIMAAHCMETTGVKVKKGNVCTHRNGTVIPCYKDHTKYRVQLFTGKKCLFASYEIEKAIPHPKFDRRISPIHDILLLKLKIPIQCSKYRLPICLPPATYNISATMEYNLPSWTVLSKIPQISSKNLGLIGFKLTSPAECIETMRETRPFSFPDKDYSFFLCMYGLRNKTACHGDSGSVLFGPIDNKMYGIAIFSGRTRWICEADKPLFFASIPGHMKWIQENTGLVPAKGKVVVRGRKCTKKRRKCIRY